MTREDVIKRVEKLQQEEGGRQQAVLSAILDELVDERGDLAPAVGDWICDAMRDFIFAPAGLLKKGIWVALATARANAASREAAKYLEETPTTD